ncbi:cob(I)yrinic acid a,c-diamide adenosyltransferase [Bacillus sp. FJAT-50079]|uniref:cob(I)yrinic acid a,c-diamide adenosyltransferase n=1 Tax=Bacillus sp. FJAT-50079 TaxID=2833577 RepID=UPI001BC97033|nr:cob(I)yrinic acid a,c-diamide adenosyltransferase [Bacillus sp. FJAT-50079]MBS4209113.1 cob(I)yrinic acid a,c-diamide adenosyltransferase [Bacillus sp. FJAT-50079]
MKIYTKTGDKGTTSLVYGQRVAKNDIRVEAYGTCDEANSMIGLALSHIPEQDSKFQEVREVFHRVQTILFHVGAELATPSGKEVKWKLEHEHVSDLETVIDKWDTTLPPLKTFILPGGHPAGAALHAARTVIRRAERCAIAIENVNPTVLSYLNRLSDFLFVAARYVNAQLGAVENKLHDS